MLKQVSLKVFFLLLGLAYGLHFSSASKQSSNSLTSGVVYDVDLTDTPIHCLTDINILQMSPDHLIFEDVGKYQVGEFITYKDFLGQIVNASAEYFAYKVDISQIIAGGTILVMPPANGEVDKSFCLGWNTADCQGPQTSFNLFKNKFLTADCDNCFLGLSGVAFAKLEFSSFKLKDVEAGFKNLNVKGGLGVSVEAAKSFNYAFNKVYPIIKSLDIASFYIGPVKVHIWVDMPIELDFGASANLDARISLGDNVNLALGSLYFDYTPGKGVSVVKPVLIPTVAPYLTTTATANGEAFFRVIPSVNFHVDNLLEFSTTLYPQLNAVASASLASRQACASGSYEVRAYVSGKVINYNFGPQTLFDTGIKSLGEICRKF